MANEGERRCARAYNSLNLMMCGFRVRLPRALRARARVSCMAAVAIDMVYDDRKTLNISPFGMCDLFVCAVYFCAAFSVIDEIYNLLMAIKWREPNTKKNEKKHIWKRETIEKRTTTEKKSNAWIYMTVIKMIFDLCFRIRICLELGWNFSCSYAPWAKSSIHRTKMVWHHRHHRFVWNMPSPCMICHLFGKKYVDGRMAIVCRCTGFEWCTFRVCVCGALILYSYCIVFPRRSWSVSEFFFFFEINKYAKNCLNSEPRTKHTHYIICGE